VKRFEILSGRKVVLEAAIF